MTKFGQIFNLHCGTHIHEGDQHRAASMLTASLHLLVVTKLRIVACRAQVHGVVEDAEQYENQASSEPIMTTRNRPQSVLSVLLLNLWKASFSTVHRSDVRDMPVSGKLYVNASSIFTKVL